jgi:hypothetical protein
MGMQICVRVGLDGKMLPLAGLENIFCIQIIQILQIFRTAGAPDSRPTPNHRSMSYSRVRDISRSGSFQADEDFVSTVGIAGGFQLRAVAAKMKSRVIRLGRIPLTLGMITEIKKLDLVGFAWIGLALVGFRDGHGSPVKNHGDPRQPLPATQPWLCAGSWLEFFGRPRGPPDWSACISL